MPGVLTSDEITEFRGLVELLAMPDTFTVRRDLATPDNEGGYTTTTETVATGDCRVRSGGGVNAGERAVADRLGWAVAYAIDLPTDVEITPKDRLIVNGSRTMEIGGIVDTGTWAMWITAVCQESSP